MPEHARKHHYVPKFYLGGFTPAGNADARLWVTDQVDGRQWQSAPAGVAFERDLYRVDATGVPPDAAEAAFSQFEGRAATVLREIERTQQIPDGTGFDILINLVALMAVRIPALRNTVAKSLEEVFKQVLSLRVETRERWDDVVAKLREKGVEVPATITYEKMKEFIQRDEYSIEFPSNWFLKHLIDGVGTLLPLLGSREWTLVVAQDGAGNFICSDRPVALVWTVPTPSFWSPGYGMPNTELTMPLTKKLALVARFESGGGVIQADRRTVATLNSRAGMYAERFVYSPTQDFDWIKQDGAIGNATALLAMIRERNQSSGSPGT